MKVLCYNLQQVVFQLLIFTFTKKTMTHAPLGSLNSVSGVATKINAVNDYLFLKLILKALYILCNKAN